MFYGFAISHELQTGFLFESDYVSRGSVYSNVERCISDAVQSPVVVDWATFECHTANAAEGMEERAELMLADMVSGLPGLESGYRLFPQIIRVTKTAEERPDNADSPEVGADAVRHVAAVHSLNVRETSLCVWVSGDTKPHREELKAAGARWSKKRGEWYWRKEQAA
jgi:hypothetical protein